MNDIQLTRHFMLSEFVKSSTAEALGIDNSPGSTGSPSAIEVISNLQYLCREILEPLREWMNEPILINSGYRCPKLNRAIGGASNSQHLSGQAADIHLPSIEIGRKYLTFILDNCRFHQVIWEHNTSGNYWIHVSIKQDGPNKQQYIHNLLND